MLSATRFTQRRFRRVTAKPFSGYAFAPFVVESLDRRLLLSVNMLVFTVQPTDTIAGGNINPATGIQVAVENSAGQIDTSDFDTFSLAPGKNPLNSSYGGLLTEPAYYGVATFSLFSFAQAGNGVTLVVRDNTNTGITSGTSVSFNILAYPVYNDASSLNAGAGAYNTNGGLASDHSGNVYGTTVTGGLYNHGSVFEMSGPGLSTYQTLASFTGIGGALPGSAPLGVLTVDANGKIYGTTSQDGADASDTGTVFYNVRKQSYNNSHAQIIYRWDPLGLAVDGVGNIYGVTNNGLASHGTVFELSGSNSNAFTTLVTFTGNTGSYLGDTPTGHLLVDASSNVFGATSAGGALGLGTVFEISGTDHAIFTTLVSFTGSTGAAPGAVPSGGLVADSSGTLIGTTTGGTLTNGSVFELSGSNDTTFTTLVNFTGNTGSFPGATPSALIIDPFGNLFGTTPTGAPDDGQHGTVFKLAASTYTYSMLASLSGTTPNTYGAPTLTYGWDYNMFGTTYSSVGLSQGWLYQVSLYYGTDAINVLRTSTTITIAPPADVSRSVYFSSISVAQTGTVALTPSVSVPYVLVTKTLTLAVNGNWFSSLNLTNNALDLKAADLATVQSQMAQGYSLGKWSGFGIRSSTANADTSHLTAIGMLQNNQSGTALFTATHTFDGTMPGASDILAKYTYYGDANLDGEVDASDYSLIDSGFLTRATGWFNGDFNYDGIINGSDYTLIDNAFNRQGASLAAQAAAVVSKSALHSVMPAVGQLATQNSFLASDETQSSINASQIFDLDQHRLRKHRAFSDQTIMTVR